MTKRAAPIEQEPASFPVKGGMRCRFELLEFKRRAAAATDAAGAAADPAADEPATYDIVISSESPVTMPWGIETLSHERSAVDLSFAKNGLSLLMEHGKSANTGFNGGVDPSLHVGIVDQVTVDQGARKLRGVARFSDSALAQQVESDVQSGIRRFISAGYKPLKAKQTKVAEKPGELSEYLFTRWQPREVSIVSVPADANGHFGRSAGDEESPIELEVAPTTTTRSAEVITMVEPQGAEPITPTAASPAASAALLEARNTAIKDRNEEIAKIIELCAANGPDIEKRSQDWVREGQSYEMVCRNIFELRKSEPKRIPGAEAIAAIPKKDRAGYRYRRAVLGLLQGEKLDGVEAEIHVELSKARPDGVQSRGGVFLPLSVMDPLGADEPELAKRTMTSLQANKGADLVFDTQGELIEILRNQPVCARLGARFLTGLSGPITFPKQSGDVTVFFVGENGSAVSNTDADIDTVLMTPKTMIGSVQYSRQLLLQTSGMVESLLRQSLGVGTGLAFDRQGLHGLGSAGQAVGIYSAPDVQTQAMASLAPTWPLITSMIGAVADRNALLGGLGFVSTALLGARLLNALQASSAGAAFIWQGRLDDGLIGGYRAIASTQASKVLGAGLNEHAFIFGNWQDMLFGMWGAIELIADEITLKKQGLIELTSFQMGDVILRHGESFVKGTAATLS